MIVLYLIAPSVAVMGGTPATGFGPTRDDFEQAVSPRLEPGVPVDDVAQAWNVPSGARRIEAVSASELWIEGFVQSTETGVRTTRTQGLYRISDDGSLQLVDDREGVVVDTDGAAWLFVKRPRRLMKFTGDEWVKEELDIRVRKPNRMAVRDGVFWSFGGAQPNDCPLPPRQGQLTNHTEIYRQDDTGVTHWRCDEVPQLATSTLAPGPDGVAYWVGWGDSTLEPLPSGPVLFRIDDAGATRLEPPTREGKPFHGNAFVAPNGELWIVRRPSNWHQEDQWLVARYDGQDWATLGVRMAVSPRQNPPRPDDRFAVGPDGRAWVATGQGLLMLEGTERKHLLESEPVLAVSVAPDGTIWLGVGGTLQQFPAQWQAAAAAARDDTTTHGPLIAFAIATATALGLAWTRKRRRTAGADKTVKTPTHR